MHHFAKDQTDAVPDAKAAAGAAAGQAGGAPAAVVETQSIDWWGITKKYGLIALIWLSIIVGVNMIFATIVALTGKLDILVLGWPLQMLVVGLACAYLMYATRWLWVSVLTNAIVIIGVLSSYYWLTGNWVNWSLWMLTAPVVVGTIIVTIILYVTNRKLASEVAYYTGLVLMAVTGTAIFGGMLFNIVF